MAAEISLLPTRTTPSSSSWQIRKHSAPTLRTATPSANGSTFESSTSRPRCRLCAMALAPAGSTPMMRTSGARRLMYDAMPAISPPPPTGTKTACGTSPRPRSLPTSRRISMPVVPWPAMTAGSSNGGMKMRPSSLARCIAYACVASYVSPTSATVPPRRLTESTLMRGVVTGMAMTASAPSCCALYATPCAWLPADEQMTPRASSSSVSSAMRL
mmetsp:Transcript_9472/g.38913  ORF Transcript_9472/g.38913 Transcript_9472/m.38913 type:complete len:215 (-) Transcript_9472:603-1247(-)